MDFSRINLDKYQGIAQKIILKASKRKFKSRREFEIFRNKIIKENKSEIFHNLYFIKAYNDLLSAKKISENTNLLSLIQKRSVRTLSGVAPVTVLTKPFPCPGRCIYCPVDSRMPKSYLASQPAAQRGFRQQFDPYSQIFVRLNALKMTGHEVSKVELRILGGTWSAYPKRYQTWFIKQCLLAMNEFVEQSKRFNKFSDFLKSQVVESEEGIDKINYISIPRLSKNRYSFDAVVKNNEKSEVRCIGINIETRPDHVNCDEVKRLRKLGVTKVEMGVQTLYDSVFKLTKRGHKLEDVIKATNLLKDAGLKVGYHIMPNLYGATKDMDIQMIKDLFEDENFKPDYLKIYPCVVLPKTELESLYKLNKYKPYNEKQLEEVIYESLKSVPEWCRIDRIARDIPSNELIAGFKTSNIRQIIERKLENEKIPCRDIRSREIKNLEVNLKDIELVSQKYKASRGVEYFISFDDIKNDKIVALLRLRLPFKPFIKELKFAAIVREVHVYGKQVAIGKKQNNQKQHSGWGTKILKKAEEISRTNGFKKVAIIAGIGTREYYRKKGYRLKGTYMVKSL